MIDKYITQLVDRMLDESDQNTVPYDSSITIHWKALREAETIIDTSFVDNIIENISTEKKAKRRDRMYFIVGTICEKTPYQKGLEFLIDRLDKETSKYIIGAICDKIKWLKKPAETDLTKLLAATKHKDWLVRHSAIPALQDANNPLVEKLMCDIVKDVNGSKHEISYAMGVLLNCASESCIPIIEIQLKNKSRIIKAEAKATIQSFADRKNYDSREFVPYKSFGIIRFGDNFNEVRSKLNVPYTQQIIDEAKNTIADYFDTLGLKVEYDIDYNVLSIETFNYMDISFIWNGIDFNKLSFAEIEAMIKKEDKKAYYFSIGICSPKFGISICYENFDDSPEEKPTSFHIVRKDYWKINKV